MFSHRVASARVPALKTARLDDVPAAPPQQAASVRALGVIPSRELDSTVMIVFASNLELLVENLAIIAWNISTCPTRCRPAKRDVILGSAE